MSRSVSHLSLQSKGEAYQRVEPILNSGPLVPDTSAQPSNEPTPAIQGGGPVVKRDHQVRFPDRFWRRATCLSQSAKGLYATLTTFADYRTGETFVSNARLQLETGFGREKVKALLLQLERAGFIERRREFRCNLKSKRFIRCLRYVVSDGLKSGPSARWTGLRATENRATILTSVRSSVTTKEKEKSKSSFPHAEEEIRERIN